MITCGEEPIHFNHHSTDYLELVHELLKLLSDEVLDLLGHFGDLFREFGGVHLDLLPSILQDVLDVLGIGHGELQIGKDNRFVFLRLSRLVATLVNDLRVVGVATTIPGQDLSLIRL